MVGTRLARQIEGRYVERFGSIEVHLGELDGGHRARRELLGQLGHREEMGSYLHGYPLRKTVSGCSSSLRGKALSCWETRMLLATARRNRSNSSDSA